LYRKSLDGNIYKQWNLGGLMVIRLVIDFGELVKVALKMGEGVGKGLGGGEVGGLLSFCGSCVCFDVFLL
jgi:hypothetical protein